VTCPTPSSFPIPPIWNVARDLCQNRAVSLWDALLVACCARAGIEVLYSEDSFGLTYFNQLKFSSPF
jgi:predicted nucleic acid-binding protein